MGIRRSKNHVTGNTRRYNLCNYILVGKSDNKSVFRSVVLVLVLIDQPIPSTIVGLALCTTLELDLESLEVSSCLLDFDEGL
nr:hypothetical protein Iba_chr07eCG2390 [Ipomoea batatas]